MPSKNEAKIKRAIHLLRLKKTHDEIRNILREEFGSAMSYSTLKELSSNLIPSSELVEGIKTLIKFFDELIPEVSKSNDNDLKKILIKKLSNMDISFIDKIKKDMAVSDY